MSAIKTKQTSASVIDFIEAVSDEKKKQDSYVLLDLFKKITQMEPKLWGKSIIGFGSYHYKSERSSQEGDWMLTGFSPRKQALTIYCMPGFEKYSDLMEKIGKHKTSVGCLYIKNLKDVDLAVLSELIERCFADMQKMHS